MCTAKWSSPQHLKFPYYPSPYSWPSAPILSTPNFPHLFTSSLFSIRFYFILLVDLLFCFVFNSLWVEIMQYLSLSIWLILLSLIGLLLNPSSATLPLTGHYSRDRSLIGKKFEFSQEDSNLGRKQTLVSRGFHLAWGYLT